MERERRPGQFYHMNNVNVCLGREGVSEWTLSNHQAVSFSTSPWSSSNWTDTLRKVSSLFLQSEPPPPRFVKAREPSCVYVPHTVEHNAWLPYDHVCNYHLCFLCLQVQNGMNSLYNTPVLWSVYILNLVLKWIEKEGGVEGMIGHLSK